VTEHRVVFDFEVDFSNGGGLQGQDFRLDIDGDDISDGALAALIVADLRLLMVGAVRITRKRIVEEPHKRAAASGTAGGTPAGGATPAATFVELSHPIRDGMVTYPGIAGPTIGTFLSREASRERYAPGTEFLIGTISMVANTGTYIDAPFHRFSDGADVAGLPATSLADLPGVVVRALDVRAGERRAIGPELLDGVAVRGRAVLLQTGWDRHFGTPAYAVDAPFLSDAAAARLVEEGAVLVGIDSLNIDSTDDPRRPCHTALLGAGIPILEHLTGLDRLPDQGFEVTALPAPVEGLGSFPVRVIARLDR
jgi:kynurenine formamidase